MTDDARPDNPSPQDSTPTTGSPASAGPSPAGPMRSHRPATIDLSPGKMRRADVSLEAAQRSLADALRITFGVVWSVLFLLALLFLASGFQQVGESERGVALRFGKVQREDITPGYVWSWPYPVGEIVRVNVGQRSLDIDDAFWPKLSRGEQSQPLSELAGRKRSLEPGVDGAVLTAGGNLAHVQWRIAYSVASPADFARAISQGQEDRIVQSIIESAVIAVIGATPIDQLLGQAAGASTPIERQVRALAQQSLDSMQSGIRLDQVILRRRTPPLFTLEAFNNVNTAAAKSAQDREQAERDRRQTLNAVAGEANEPFLRLIDQYERALELADQTRAGDLLATIDQLLDGEAVEIEGRAYTASGEVSQIINDARRYRTDTVADARRRAQSFAAKLPQYRANPRVFVASEWRRAYAKFREQGIDETFFLPISPSDVEILLNSDPEIAERLEKARNTADAQRAREESIKRQTDLARERNQQQQRSGGGGG